MKKLGDISQWQLAAIIAISTILAGLAVAGFSAFFIDKKTERETDVRILELAIGILGEPRTEDGPIRQSERALRLWAFDTINAVSEVKIPESARLTVITNGISPSITRENVLEYIRRRLIVGRGYSPKFISEIREIIDTYERRRPIKIPPDADTSAP